MIKHLDQKRRIRNIVLILLSAALLICLLRSTSLFEQDYLERLEKHPPKNNVTKPFRLGIFGYLYRKSLNFPIT